MRDGCAVDLWQIYTLLSITPSVFCFAKSTSPGGGGSDRHDSCKFGMPLTRILNSAFCIKSAPFIKRVIFIVPFFDTYVNEKQFLSVCFRLHADTLYLKHSFTESNSCRWH